MQNGCFGTYICIIYLFIKMATKTKGTKTLPKVGKKNLEETNKEVVTQKVIINRKLKYIYPKGCTNTLARKAYRQKVRNMITKMESKISKLRGEDRRILKEKLHAYQMEHLTQA